MIRMDTGQRVTTAEAGLVGQGQGEKGVERKDEGKSHSWFQGPGLNTEVLMIQESFRITNGMSLLLYTSCMVCPQLSER